jgi:DNA mismatch endonuclease (patch repair protein)
MALTRSQQMARIKGRDTKPEKRLRGALWRRGLRYRLNARVPVGKPDMVFPGQRLLVFVDGCFWHGCPLHYVRPRSRCAFWADKLRANVERDRRHTEALEAAGFTVLRLWEHDVEDALEQAADTVERALRHGQVAHAPAWRVVRVEVIDEGRDWERRVLEDLRDATRTRSEDGPRQTRSGKPRRARR